jgi:hypothetical protein
MANHAGDWRRLADAIFPSVGLRRLHRDQQVPQRLGS